MKPNLTLEALRSAHQESPAWEDAGWGVTTELRDDGASVVKPLTLDRLDAWAARVWVDPRDHDGYWSISREMK